LSRVQHDRDVEDIFPTKRQDPGFLWPVPSQHWRE
jgi:hypothetical protein